MFCRPASSNTASGPSPRLLADSLPGADDRHGGKNTPVRQPAPVLLEYSYIERLEQLVNVQKRFGCTLW